MLPFTEKFDSESHLVIFQVILKSIHSKLIFSCYTIVMFFWIVIEIIIEENLSSYNAVNISFKNI